MDDKIKLVDWTGHKDRKQAFEWAYGINRGELMKRFLEKNNINMRNKNVLDVGSNQGGISIAFSGCSKNVISFDNEISWIKTMKKRLKKRNIKNISIFIGDANNIPLKDGFFDIVLVVGVMEWIALNKDENPKKIHLSFLRDINRILKKNGVLYLAIENRFYLGHFFSRDPHSGLMFGSILPRIIANMYSKIVNKKPYETYIYSYYGLKELLNRAGFKKNSFFIPFPGYQFPEDVCELNNKKDLIKLIGRCEVADFKKLAGKIIIKLNLSKIFLHNFIVISKKY